MAILRYRSDMYRLRKALVLRHGACLATSGPQVGVGGVPVGGLGDGGGSVHVGHGPRCAALGGSIFQKEKNKKKRK